MVLPQFAHYRSPCFEFFVNTTENHRNLVHEGWWFLVGLGFLVVVQKSLSSAGLEALGSWWLYASCAYERPP